MRARALALLLALALVPGLPGIAARAAQKSGTPAPAAPAAPAPEPPPPVYDASLQRLAEILGALHFLRGLCGEDDAALWQEEMQALLDAEKPAPTRRAQLVARFNYGYATYDSVYRTCTPNARRAIALYLQEGRRLSADIRRRFGQ
ncbi:TIGR02301 family protein [Propylenella binzhouense]|uniref:TIGR02301 family protein n=1 Tax=Propylenella binzhouense TaxID=2555902 RepID=UPI0031B62E31